MAGVDSCASLDVVNIKPDLGLRLGLRGLLACHSTFSPMPQHIGAAPISWTYWADRFVRNMYAIEARYKLVSNVPIAHRLPSDSDQTNNLSAENRREANTGLMNLNYRIWSCSCPDPGEATPGEMLEGDCRASQRIEFCRVWPCCTYRVKQWEYNLRVRRLGRHLCGRLLRQAL
jgi:hypothetical protein